MRKLSPLALLLLFLTGPASAQVDCTGTISPECLGSLGAGAQRAPSLDCTIQLETYSRCLSDAAADPIKSIGQDRAVEIGALVAHIVAFARQPSQSNWLTAKKEKKVIRSQILDVMDHLGDTIEWRPREIRRIPGRDPIAEQPSDTGALGVSGTFRALISGEEDRDFQGLSSRPWKIYILAGEWGFNNTEARRVELVRKFYSRFDETVASVKKFLPGASFRRCGKTDYQGLLTAFGAAGYPKLLISHTSGSDGSIVNLTIFLHETSQDLCALAKEFAFFTYDQR